MFSKVSIVVILVSTLSLIVGIAAAIFVINLVLTTGLAGNPNVNHLHELFARFAIVLALVGFAIAIFQAPSIPKRTDYGLHVHVMFAIFGAGAMIALLDPFSQIWNEFNLIRYPTAIVLTTAGFLLVRTALIRQRHVLLRLLSGGLGLLLVLAAVDEIFELHEQITVSDDTYFNDAIGVSTQDLSTLFVAVAGIVVAAIAHRLVRMFAKRGLLGAGGREVAAADLFLAAGIAFLAAMLLDSFDGVFANTARSVLSLFLPENHAFIVEKKPDGYFETLANSIEEFLEYAAAVLLLSTALVFSFEPRR